MQVESITVLLIEDSIKEALPVKRLLINEGINVIHTDSWEETISAIKNGQVNIDLLLLDFDLIFGDPNGIKLLHQISKDLDIPVVILYSETEKEVFEKTEEIAPYGLIVKGSAGPVILSSIRLAIKLHRQNRHLRAAESALRKSEANLSITLHSIGDGVISTDIKGNIVSMNPVAERLCGWNFNEAKGRHLSEVFHIINAQSRESVINPVEKVLETGLVIGLANHTVLVSRNGDEYQIADSAAPIKNETGEQFGVVLVFSDVTDKYKSEEALRGSEELFRTTFENATAGICLTGPDGRFLRINNTLCRMLGYSAEELKILGFNDITHPGDKQIGASALKNLVDGIIDHANIEKRYIKKNGQIIWSYLSIAIVRDALSKPKYFITHIQDISERIRAEEALLQNEKKYRLLFENNPLPMWIYALNTLRFLEVNKAAVETYGYSRKEFLQMTLKDIRPESDINALLQNVASTRDEYSKTTAWRHKKKNGEIFFVEIISQPIVYESEEARLVLSNDITERITAQQELLRAKREAEKSDKLKSEFLAQMSHEIRSPISTMLNFISLIKEEVPKPLNEEMLFSFNAIDSSSRRLIRTIDLILNMSQVQTGYLECNYKLLDLERDILNNVINEYSNSAALKGLNLSITNKCDTPRIIADSYTLIQIFSNLINNAIKYTRSGNISVIIYADNNNICVDVSDTGIGISEEYINHIFAPFSQEEQGYTRKFEGNGLGLALVKKYCELNQAKISVQSKKGHGSTFTVIFGNNKDLINQVTPVKHNISESAFINE